MTTRAVDEEVRATASRPSEQGVTDESVGVKAQPARHSAAVLAPETLEGWYAVHQVWRADRAAIRRLSPTERHALAVDARSVWSGVASAAGLAAPAEEARDGQPAAPEGWSVTVELVGSLGDLMVMHFRPTL